MSNYNNKNDKSYMWRDLVYRIIYHAFWLFEAVLLIYLFYTGKLSGIKVAFFAVAYVFLSCVCMEVMNMENGLMYHLLFLITKFGLAADLFDRKMQIIVAVVVMTVANILVKLLLQFVIIILNLYERQSWLDFM